MSEKNKPAISIIVPVYKVEAYLDECVQSIITQSFTDFELILVDDGSPDRCGAMCDEYARRDSRVRVLHQENVGQAGARNAGICLAEGAGLAFVDSDDVLAPDSLGKLWEEMQATGADIVLGRVLRFDDNGNTRPYGTLNKRKEMKSIDALMLILEGSKINISVCGGLYRREVWEGLKMPIGYVCEDLYVTPDLYLRANKVIYTPVLWYMYRDNAQSTMASLYRKCNPQVLEVVEHVISVIKAYDYNLYLATLWSALRRAWKYVGIVYTTNRQQEEAAFLESTRELLRRYWTDLPFCGRMRLSETIGVWSFLNYPSLCNLLYGIKTYLTYIKRN